jgi:hypothetical protein
MVGEDWYKYLAATNQRIVEARGRIAKQRGRIEEAKQERRSIACLAARLRSLEDTLQGLTARRERILKIVRTYPLRAVDNSGAGREQPQDQIVRLHCPAIQGLPRETVHALHKGLVTIALMRMSIEFAGIQLRRSHRALLESNELLERVCKDGF